MTSFVRPIVISLLCGMAALGHAPAWLHVAGCDHESHSQLTPEPETSGTSHCHHGCSHHVGEAAKSGPERASDQRADHSHGGHDSDSCLLCQSLGLPNGVVWHLELPSFIRDRVEFVSVSRANSPESTLLSIPQPRGPPAPLA